jgi:RimJ/RimL family protein N-acetyltransferase
VELRTARLLLRNWREEDRSPFARLNADPEVRAHLGGAVDRATSDGEFGRGRAMIDALGYGFWALERLADGAFLGFCGIKPVSFEARFTPAVEIGWRLAREYWGQGYASEAARISLEYGFETLGLAEIVSFTVPANLRSQAVMHRLGFRADGGFDHPKLPEGDALRWHLLFRLARAEWAGKHF